MHVDLCTGYFFYICLLDEMHVDLVVTECAQTTFTIYYLLDKMHVDLCTGYLFYMCPSDELHVGLVVTGCAQATFPIYACLTRCVLTWLSLNVRRLPFLHKSVG